MTIFQAYERQLKVKDNTEESNQRISESRENRLLETGVLMPSLGTSPTQSRLTRIFSTSLSEKLMVIMYGVITPLLPFNVNK